MKPLLRNSKRHFCRQLRVEPLELRLALATLSGVVFNDIDADGQFVPKLGETPISGQTVYVDLNGNGRFDSVTEPSQLSGPDGKYLFDGLAAGSYSVGQVLAVNSAQTFPANPGAIIRHLDLQLGKIVYSSVSGKIYANVSNEASVYTGCLVVIDPTTGSVESSVFVGDTRGLAISDDAQFAYLAMNDAGAVQRVALRTLTLDLRFQLGSDVNGPFYALDMAVMPGNPHAIAITRYSRQIQPGLKGIAIYDDGIPRPQTTSQFDSAELLTFSDAASTLYAYNDIVSGQHFYRLSVTASGVSILDSQEQLVAALFNERIEFDGGRVYSTSGRVIDPVSNTLLGTFPRQSEHGDASPVESIPSRKLTFFLGDQRLQAFDSETFVPIASLDLPALTGDEQQLIHYGSTNYAYVGVDGLNLIDWDPRPAVQRVTLASDETRLNVNFGNHSTVPPGSISGRVFHDLNSSGAQDAGEPGIASWTVYVDSNANAQFDAGEFSTVTDVLGNYQFAGLPPQTYTVAIAQQPGWNQTAPTKRQTGRVRQLDLDVSEMLYDPLRGKIYAAIRGGVEAIGNSVAEIDPISGTVNRFAYVGSEPRSLSLSDDGKYLYVGLEGAGAVRRVELASFTAGLQFSLGNDFFSGPYIPDDVQAVAGSNSAVAVASPMGVAIYDNGIRRPQTTSHDTTGVAALTGSANPSILYGLGSPNALVQLSISAQGVTVGNTTKNLLGLTYGIKYDNGRIYTTNGKAVDAATASLLGTYAATGWWVEPVSSRGLTYFIADGEIKAFDQQTFALVGTVKLEGADIRADDLIHWGDNGLAYRTDRGHVVLVEWDPRDPQFTTPLPVHLTRGQQATGSDFGILNTSPINPPLGVTDQFATTEEVGFSLATPGVLANDLDFDNAALTAVLVSGPANGALTLSMDGSFSYQPKANFRGTDSFTYRASDNLGLSEPTTVSIVVASVNDIPRGTSDAYTTPQDTPLIATTSNRVLKNDSDADSDVLTAVLETRPTHGTLVLNSDGTFSYTPDAGFGGTDRFTYRASDGQSVSNTATVTINVTAVNNAPVAASDAYVVNQDAQLVVAAPGVLANDADVEGSPLTISVHGSPSHGTVEISSSGAFTYTPISGYFGPDSFTYRAGGGQLNSNVATVSLNVLPANSASVSGRLFDDVNQDGVFDPGAGEQPLAGRTVYADLNDNGSYDANTEPFQVTAADGSYALMGLPPGAVRVSQLLLTGWKQSSPTSSTNIFAAVSSPGRGFLVEYTPDGKRVQTISVPPPPSQSGVWHTKDVAVDAAGRIHVLQKTSSVAYISTYTPWTKIWEHHTYAGFAGSTQNGEDNIFISGDFLYTGLTRFNINDWTYKIFTPPDITGGFMNVTLGLNGKLYASNAGSPTNAVYEFDPDTFALLRTIGLRDESGKGVGVGAVTAQGDFYSPVGGRVLHFNSSGNLLGSYAFHTGTWSTADTSLTAEGYLAIGNIDGRLAVVKTDFTDSHDFVVSGGSNPPEIYTSFSTYQGTGLTASSYVLNLAAGAGVQGLDFGSFFAGVNPALAVQDDSFSVMQDTKLTLPAPGVLVNDQAAAGGSFVVSRVNSALFGSAIVNSDGSVTYTPNKGFHGSDQFTYRVHSGSIDTGEVTVRINVIANDPPVAVNDRYATTRDTPLAIAGRGVLSNDVDDNSNDLAAVLVTQPQHGTLTFHANGALEYVPENHFIGTDLFTYRVNDGTLNSAAVAAVYIDIKGINVPVALGDNYTTAEESLLHVDALAGVLKNDSDPLGRTLSALLVGPALHGSVTLNSDGSIDYLPAGDFVGIDSFLYQATGGDDPAVASVSITVTAVNDPPRANDDGFVTMEDVKLTVSAIGVLANDYDIDSSSLQVAIEGQASHGTVSQGSNGSFVYIPALDFSGTDSFTYRVSDGTALKAIATVSITVVSVNDRPSATNDGFQTEANVPIAVAAPGVLMNDRDSDAELLSAILASGPTQGQLTLNDDGSFAYVPNRDFKGVDSFSYRANDDKTLSVPATVTLLVGVHPPVAYNDVATVSEDGTIEIPITSLFANDSDADGDSLELFISDDGGPAHGILTRTDDALIYRPVGDFSGADQFTYYVRDSQFSSNVATVSIAVSPVNDPPIFSGGDDLTISSEAGPQQISQWATNISPGAVDEAGQTLNFVVLSVTNGGLFEAPPKIDAAGNLRFTPTPNSLGSAHVKLVLRDDGGVSSDGLDESLPYEFDIRIVNALPYHNHVLATDVTGDGDVEAEDVLRIINFINAHGSGPISQQSPTLILPMADEGQINYYDVTGDNYIAPDDVVAVINYINARPGQSEALDSSPVVVNNSEPASPPLGTDLLNLIAADGAASQLKRRRWTN